MPRRRESDDLELRLYRGMCLVREVEERLATLFADGEIPGFIHLSIGQEAVPVGIAAALDHAAFGRDRPNAENVIDSKNLARDTLASNHRGHGHAIAKGLALDRFFLEIMGKEEGYCRGRGGSMHVADMSLGMLGANGIVGAGLSIALGSAMAHKVRGTDQVAVVFFGDGALAEGLLHESFNLAKLWALPLLLVCENNGWSEFSEVSRQLATDAVKLADAFGIAHARVDGNDVMAVHGKAAEAVARLRAGDGPFLLECVTQRVRGHFEGDPQKYRDAADIETAQREDPLHRCEALLAKLGVTSAAIAEIREDVARQVSDAVTAARAGSAPSAAAALADVYSPARSPA